MPDAEDVVLRRPRCERPSSLSSSLPSLSSFCLATRGDAGGRRGVRALLAPLGTGGLRSGAGRGLTGGCARRGDGAGRCCNGRGVRGCAGGGDLTGGGGLGAGGGLGGGFGGGGGLGGGVLTGALGGAFFLGAAFLGFAGSSGVVTIKGGPKSERRP